MQVRREGKISGESIRGLLSAQHKAVKIGETCAVGVTDRQRKGHYRLQQDN
jgi:hypothetical protein